MGRHGVAAAASGNGFVTGKNEGVGHAAKGLTLDRTLESHIAGPCCQN
ncbi:MAG: hypothetical protein ACR2O7_07675 [Parasphingorhabdus sp.]